MSQQINLYDPALLKKRELLTATHLAATALVLLVGMGGWGASIRGQLAALEAESQSVSPKVKSLQDLKASLDQQLATVKPDPRLEAALASARTVLGLRGEIVAVLKKGVGSESLGFAEYLRGFARQSHSGLWLTSFNIGENGANMEIHGRMTDPALLPDYIRRLNSEKAFKGRAFASLTISSGKAAQSEGAAAAAPAPASPAATAAGRAAFHEFVLIPSLGPADGGRRPTEGSATNSPDKLASATMDDVLPPEVSRALGEAGRKALEPKR